MWQTIGGIEIEGMTLHGDDPITADILREVARSYDPGLREAVVIAAPEGAAESGHFAGQYGPLLGAVRAVGSDGVFLWADVEPVEDAYRARVDAGYRYPSVYIRRNSELDGSPWYLAHVALLSGEMPGTPNLGRFRSLDAAMRRGTKREHWRAQITTEATVGEHNAAAPDTGADDKVKAAKAAEDPAPEAKEGGSDDAARSAEVLAGTPSGEIVRAAKLAGTDSAELLRAIQGLSVKVAEQSRQLETMRAERVAERAEAARVEVRRSIDVMIGSGRLRAVKDPDKLTRSLVALDEEARAEILRSLEASEPPALAEELSVEVDGESQVVVLDDYRYRMGEGPSGVPRDSQAEIAKVRAACTGKDGKVDQVAFESGLIALRRKGVA